MAEAPAAGEVLFEETQSFRQPWIWCLLVGVFLVVTAAFIAAQEPADNVVTFVLVWGGVSLFLFILKLTVRVVPGHLHVRFFPLLWKDITLADIASSEARTYRPLLEYGGWGLRYSLGRGWAYNVNGNRGVQLTFKNGKRLLIGSQKSDELAAAIARAKGGEVEA